MTQNEIIKRARELAEMCRYHGENVLVVAPLSHAEYRELADVLTVLSTLVTTPAHSDAAQLLADLRDEFEDEFEDDSEPCRDCGEIFMCRYHSVVSALHGRTWTTKRIARDNKRRASAR